MYFQTLNESSVNKMHTIEIEKFIIGRPNENKELSLLLRVNITISMPLKDTLIFV